LSLSLGSLALLLLLDLEEEGTVDVGKDTTERDGGPDERVELLVTTDGKLEMSRCNALDLEVLGGVLLREMSADVTHIDREIAACCAITHGKHLRLRAREPRL
jgi:chromosome condensin MukBEF ATPase and DNA-binding subunit MukB